MVSPISGAFFDAPFSLIFLVAIFFIHPLMGFFFLFGLLMALIVGILIEKKYNHNRKRPVEHKVSREMN